MNLEPNCCMIMVQTFGAFDIEMKEYGSRHTEEISEELSKSACAMRKSYNNSGLRREESGLKQ